MQNIFADMDETTIAVMARLDLVRDDVSEMKAEMREHTKAHHSHSQRLLSVENTVKNIEESQDMIMNGPIYSLDRFITKRVAQVTGGAGILIYAIYMLITGQS